MRVPPRVPSVRLPRTDRPFGQGIVLAALLHAAVVAALLLWGGTLVRYARGLGLGPGDLGGGGGGVGPEIQYLQLPPLGRAEAPAERAAPPATPEPEPEPVELTLPAPEIVASVPEEARLPVAVETPVSMAATEFPRVGNTGGPGAGPGTGGGIGAGRGTGIGSHTGPGTGGDGGSVLAPEPRVVAYPYDEAPQAIRGQTFTVRFWVDDRGRVNRVEIDPPIDDAGFRRKLLERFRQWTFYPARTLAGSPVNGQYVATYQP